MQNYTKFSQCNYFYFILTYKTTLLQNAEGKMKYNDEIGTFQRACLDVFSTIFHHLDFPSDKRMFTH